MDHQQPPPPVWLQHQASLLNPNWKYIPAAATNILERFRAMGWVPPSELKNAKID